MSRNSTGGRDLEEIIDSLYRKGLTDGLPVVPPTEERVEELLRGTDHPPDHELGKLGNRDGSLTVQKLAINGVMAGCSPLHMPVLVAGARALADPDSNAIQTSVSTGSWAYFWLINGPVRNELEIGCGAGAFGPGYRSNKVLGRALGLAYKNTAIIHPGEKDMGVMGNPAKYSTLAGENEEASPWEPFHVTHGHDADDSTITLAAPNGFGQYINRRSRKPADLLVEMIEHTPSAMAGSTRESFRSWVIHSLAPANAKVLDNAGLSKQDVKEYLCENMILSSSSKALDFITRDGGGAITNEKIETLPSYWRCQIDTIENLKLPVIGGTERENVVIGPSLGGPVTVKIEFPDAWEELLAEYGDDSGKVDGMISMNGGED